MLSLKSTHCTERLQPFPATTTTRQFFLLLYEYPSFSYQQHDEKDEGPQHGEGKTEHQIRIREEHQSGARINNLKLERLDEYLEKLANEDFITWSMVVSWMCAM